MNHDLGQVKEEYAGASSSYSGMASTAIPQPMEGLHDAGPPPFLTKTYDIVEDTATNHIVSWSRGNNSFVVWDPQTFSMSLLPRYFKHNNFSSFVRQLNTYGFRKVDPDRWEFANGGFLRGQKHLLKDIRRRKAPQPQSCQQCLDPCVEVERFGVDGEVDRLKRDKQVLMMELLKLRRQQQNTKACLQLMEHELKRTETKQQQMMGFLARAIKNPNFVQKLIQQKDRRKELEEALDKKRRRSIDQGRNNVKFRDFDHIGGDVDTCIKIELQEFDDLPDFEASELGALAMTLQDVSGSQQHLEEECNERGEEHKDKGKDLDEGFWDELLNRDIGDEMVMCGEAEDVDVLVEQLGYLGSSPK